MEDCKTTEENTYLNLKALSVTGSQKLSIHNKSKAVET
jgi:hypothetical protein